MKNKSILTDCDGVLLNWCTAFHDWMNGFGLFIKDDKEYSMAKAYGISEEDAEKYLNLACCSEMMKRLRPFSEEDVGVIQDFVKKGWRISVLTATIDHPVIHNYRKENLINVFGENVFDQIICSDFSGKKIKHLKDLKSEYSYWVEDKVTNYKDGKSLGYKSFLMHRPWNKHLIKKSKYVVNNWKEIYDILMKE